MFPENSSDLPELAWRDVNKDGLDVQFLDITESREDPNVMRKL